MNTPLYTELPSGLAIPVEKPAPAAPKRQLGPLEIDDADRREQAHRHLQSLVHLVNRNVLAPGVSQSQLRAIRFLANELLGDDADFEELC